MSLEENKALVHRLVNNVANEGRYEELEELLVADYVEHNAPPGIPPGREAFKQMTLIFRNAFPDWHFTVEDTIAEGDRVAIRGMGRGTHQGAFLGIPPTGKQITMQAMHLFHVRDGKIVARWAQADIMGLLQQLRGNGPGVAPQS
ncbi:MAG TPA: ester cyclase [Chloroflexia bacterium]|nr:ester cyclase [Chloroflexia bacterium]